MKIRFALPRAAPFGLLTLVALVACQPSNSQSVGEPRNSITLSWLTAPTPVMPRVFDGEALTVPCVTVLATAAATAAGTPGAPLKGIDLTLTANPGGSAAAQATTDNDGTAQFCGLGIAPGAAAFTVSAAGASDLTSDPFLVAAATAVLAWLRQPVSGVAGAPLVASDGSCPAVVVTTAPPAVGASDAGALGDADGGMCGRCPCGELCGVPLKGVDVKLGKNPGGGCAARAGSQGSCPPSVATDENGVATFCGLTLDPGATTLSASLDGVPAAQLDAVAASPVTDPFVVSPPAAVVAWLREPVAGVTGLPLVASDGSCPAVVVTSSLQPGSAPADGGAADAGLCGNCPCGEICGAPLKGIDVKLGKNPGGGCAARVGSPGSCPADVSTDQNGIATFCGLTVDPGAVSLTASIDSLAGAKTSSTTTFSPAVTDPFAMSPYWRIVAWTAQPPQLSISQGFANGACPSVLVSVTAGLGDDPTAPVLPGQPVPGVNVTFVVEPSGQSQVIATGPTGVATLCSPDITAMGAYNLQASVDGSQPVLSNAFGVTK